MKALMKKTGVTGVVVEVGSEGAVDDEGKVKPLKPVALPFTTYVHTNDPAGHSTFYGATPYDTHGYVDITRLPNVLRHRKCGYGGRSTLNYQHVAVFDKNLLWHNVLADIVLAMSKSENRLVVLEFAFGFGPAARRVAVPGKNFFPEFACPPANRPEASLMDSAAIQAGAQLSTLGIQRSVRVSRADPAVTRWRIDDSVLANTPTPKEIITISLLYGTSAVKIQKSLV